MATKSDDNKPTVIMPGEENVYEATCTGEGNHPADHMSHCIYKPGKGCGAKLNIRVAHLFTMPAQEGRETELCFECPQDGCGSITRMRDEDVATLNAAAFPGLDFWKGRDDDPR